MIPLVDGDIVTFRAAFGAEHNEYDLRWTDEEYGEQACVRFRYKVDAQERKDALALQGIAAEMETVHILEPLSHALHNVNSIIDSIKSACAPTEEEANMTRIFLSGPSEDNFRMQVGTIRPYKGNRDKAHRPTYEHEVKRYLVSQYGAEYTYGQEADDALGIAQCAAPPGTTVIVSNDKDLKMIPGWNYDFTTGIMKFMDEYEAEQMFLHQLLKGDFTDNILGVPGIGEQKARQALDTGYPWEQIWALYVQGYGLAAYPALLENGNLLWIRREENQEWTPALHGI